MTILYKISFPMPLFGQLPFALPPIPTHFCSTNPTLPSKHTFNALFSKIPSFKSDLSPHHQAQLPIFLKVLTTIYVSILCVAFSSNYTTA